MVTHNDPHTIHTDAALATLTISCQPCQCSSLLVWISTLHDHNCMWEPSFHTLNTYSNKSQNQTGHSGALLVTLTISCQPRHCVPVCWYGSVQHMTKCAGGESLYLILTPNNNNEKWQTTVCADRQWLLIIIHTGTALVTLIISCRPYRGEYTE